jgi:predicted deacylase
VLLYEGGKSLDLDDSITDIGVKGALNVMQHLGIRDFSLDLEKMNIKEAQKPVVIEKSIWIRARFSGMFRNTAILGKRYKKGEEIGSISDPFGFFEKKIKMPMEGYVFCINHSPIVNKGDAIFHISN